MALCVCVCVCVFVCNRVRQQDYDGTVTRETLRIDRQRFSNHVVTPLIATLKPQSNGPSYSDWFSGR